MENRLEHNAPLFEVKYELQVPHDVFIPNLDTSSEIGFMKVIDDMLLSIYAMSDVIRRISMRHLTDENGEPYPATYESKNDFLKSILILSN